jgi:hypothetical protein
MRTNNSENGSAYSDVEYDAQAIELMELDFQDWLAQGGLVDMLRPEELMHLDLSDPEVVSRTATMLGLDPDLDYDRPDPESGMRWGSLLAAYVAMITAGPEASLDGGHAGGCG